jgi:predicted DNA-binding transcriptional regulator AlpA
MEHLGVSRNTVSTYVRSGMPAHKIRGGRYLYDLREIDAWIDSRWSSRNPGQYCAS